MTINDCNHCGGTHYGSLKCPYICERCGKDIRPDETPHCECRALMTDQKPDRQDGDGLLPDEMEHVLGFVSDASVAIHDEPIVVWVDSTGEWWGGLPQSFIKLSDHNWTVDRWEPLPTRDGAEGANDLPPDAEHPINYRKAFAKPAPDAMRNAVARYLCKLVRRFQTASECGDDCVMCIDGSGTGYWQDEADKVLALSAPVPPADGAREEPEVIAARICERIWSKKYQTLRTMEKVSIAENEIVKAIKAERLSPSPAVAAASPPVRGDRETLQKIAEFCSDDANKLGAIKRLAEIQRLANDALSLLVQPVAPRLPQDTLDRLANADSSQEEIGNELTKAYSILRWNAKLDDLLDDMKDDCYGFAGSVQSGAGERP